LTVVIRKKNHAARHRGFFAGSRRIRLHGAITEPAYCRHFVNFEVGDFEHTRFYSTAGVAVTSIQWKVARQFAFFENNVTWKATSRFTALCRRTRPEHLRCEFSGLLIVEAIPRESRKVILRCTFSHSTAWGRHQSQLFRSLPTYDPGCSPPVYWTSISFKASAGCARRTHEAHQRI